MTSEEAFKQWWDNGVAHPVNVGYDCAVAAWKAACKWQQKEVENTIIFHLNEDSDGDFFLTKESFAEIFLEQE